MTGDTDLTRWLVQEGARLGTMPAVLLALTGLLRDAGVPVDRLTSGEPTLHPEARVYAYRWSAGDAYVQEASVQHGIQHTDGYKNSPFRLIYETDTEIVRQKLDQNNTLQIELYNELSDEGYTDYVALPLTYSNGGRAPIALATKAAGGFSDEAVALLKSMMPALSLIAEVHAGRRLTRGLLETYLGRNAGGQVLAGHVERGDVQVINAVIWYCDLRGFTALSDRLPGDFLVHVLNDYFAAMGEAVRAMDGEILKFIGDGMLAIFRIEPDDEQATICEQAMTAAELAMAGMRRLNRRRNREGKPTLESGIALHVGDVMYGNIGTSGRLDFTVIGPAVNLAARLEQLAAERRLPLITSEAFAAIAPDVELTSIGRHQLKGIEAPQEAFTTAAAAKGAS